MYLGQAGLEVEIARDGVTGLARAQRPGVDLVILDWMIPGLNGQEVCRRLRAVSAVPILMPTARTSDGDCLGGFETGADDYVPKPFSPREVVARVQVLLRVAMPGSSGPPPIRIGALTIDVLRRQVEMDGREVALTRRSFIFSRRSRDIRAERCARSCWRARSDPTPTASLEPSIGTSPTCAAARARPLATLHRHGTRHGVSHAGGRRRWRRVCGVSLGTVDMSSLQARLRERVTVRG